MNNAKTSRRVEITQDNRRLFACPALRYSRAFTMKRALCATLLAVSLGYGIAYAEQMQEFGDWEVHYTLFPTGFLQPEIASQYQVTRGRDRALLNISVLDVNDHPVRAEVTGIITNLLGQKQALEFREVREGDAVYYLAGVRHTDREVLRFRIAITPPGDGEKILTFQQTLYWEGR